MGHVILSLPAAGRVEGRVNSPGGLSAVLVNHLRDLRVILSGALHRAVRGGAKNVFFPGSRFDCAHPSTVAPFDFAQGG